jgi:uncharacterized protein (TIGR00730 family)
MRICVFCGAGRGARPEYGDAAASLGRALAERKLGLVYGGARVGLMGRVANAALEAGGEVIGVIPRVLERAEIAHHGITELRLVDTMPQRKELMAELSDGFVALPGGIGTLDELFEVLAWAQLGFHHKPCGLLNTQGYFDPLLDFLSRAKEERFVEADPSTLLVVEQEPDQLLQRLQTAKPRIIDKARWILENGG